MIAREYLAEIERKRARIDNLRKEISDLRESINLLPGVSYDGLKVQTSTTDAQVLAAVESLVDKERRLIALVEEYQRDRSDRIMTVHLLTKKDHMTVLYARYVTGLYWWEIEEQMRISHATVYRLHEAALKELGTILEEKNQKIKNKSQKTKNETK